MRKTFLLFVSKKLLIPTPPSDTIMSEKKTDLDWIDEDNARNTFGATIPLLIVRWKRGEI